MCGTDDIAALDFPRVCGAAFLVRESVIGETDFARRGVDHVSGGVAGLPPDAEQACAYSRVGGIFCWEEAGFPAVGARLPRPFRPKMPVRFNQPAFTCRSDLRIATSLFVETAAFVSHFLTSRVRESND